MNVYYQLSVLNKKEKLRFKTPKIQSRSFLKPFLYLLCPRFGGTGIQTVDIDNAGQTPSAGVTVPVMWVQHPGREAEIHYRYSNYTTNRVGIQVGTGTNAVTINDYALQTPIVHGDSAGEFVHYGTWLYNYTVGASTATFDAEKIFYNDSGGSITVNETALYGIYLTTTHTSHCLIRDKLSSGVAVADTEYLKVKYTISVSV